MPTNNEFIREYDGDGRTVMIKRVRASFTDSLKDAKPSVADGPPKHTANFIIESDQPGFDEKKAAIGRAIKAACVVTWKNPDRYKVIQEDDPKRIAYRKGERFKNQESGEVYAGYAGNMAIAAAGPMGGKKRPKMLNRRGNDVAEADIEDVVYSGCYVDLKVSFYGTDKGGAGVFATIEAIKSREIGERMGGGVSTSADEFDEYDDSDDDSDDDAFDRGEGSSGDDDF